MRHIVPVGSPAHRVPLHFHVVAHDRHTRALRYRPISSVTLRAGPEAIFAFPYDAHAPVHEDEVIRNGYVARLCSCCSMKPDSIAVVIWKRHSEAARAWWLRWLWW